MIMTGDSGRKPKIGHLQSESAVTFGRNGRSRSNGISGQIRPEYARVMFYYPNRTQAIRVQRTLETLYEGVDGRYYYGAAAWNYIRDRTGADLKVILEELVAENVNAHGN